MHSHLLFTSKRFLLVLELCDQVNLPEAPKPLTQCRDAYASTANDIHGR